MRRFGILLLLIISQQAFTQTRKIDSLSVISLKIETYNNNSQLSTATGFVIEKNNKYYLITNLHVLTGVDYYSHAIQDSLQRIPNWIAIWHNAANLGYWQKIGEPLYNNDNTKRWIECGHTPDKPFDIVALPLSNLPNTISLYPLDIIHHFNSDMRVLPGFPASIIGFPYGLSAAGRLAIWKTGHIASDLDVDSDGLPIFMIDATTRPGMSGSVVVVRQSNYVDTNGTTMVGSIGTLFTGIYSAQSNQEEIGYVWKPSALKLLIEKLP
ncbi:S1 family peptidase [Mucilaginibacter sp. R-33]|uniref:S1 family peptidase n=1 Tax=Mucilaginibacter sp. R-33 TaxID=3416711 RepID=UPI003CF08A92